METPCKKNCPNRNPYCHGSCEDYLNWKKWFDIKNEKIRKEKFKESGGYWFDTKTRRRRRKTGV